jgi:uncharacterized protein YihD (DUF1040 family)
MRSPDRIDPALELLRQTWSANPDLRLGQIIYNAAYVAAGGIPPNPGLYFMEDDILLVHLSANKEAPTLPSRP